MTSWWSDHPDLEGVARRGRGEMRQEAEDVERDADHLRRRQRSLVEVCFEWMSRGDLVTIGVGDTEYQGRLVAALNDLLVLVTPTMRVAVDAGAVRSVRSDRPAAHEGSSGDRIIGSFQALLGSFEVEGRPVRLLDAAGSFDVTGVVTATTADHVDVRDGDGREWVLARRAVTCLLETIDG
jgi:hypothetical protein